MGSRSNKKAKNRLDAYYRAAKESGYRSRASFKLIQLNKKYDFLSKSKVVVDLCAAPGGWLQVCAQNCPVGSKIIGVDLVPIPAIRGVKTFVGDITDDKTLKTIRTWLKKEPVDCVIHDGAPNVGGVWAKDLYVQNALVLSAAKTAAALLNPGGWFVTKVFRSPDYQKLIWVLKQLWEKVEATKPLASRMESAEIFVTCHGFKAPKQLDPRLFNAQHVFADVGEEKLVTASGALVAPKTSVPQGYGEEDFATFANKVVTLTEFLDSADPKTLLQTQHEVRFVTEEEKALMKSRHCKPELIFLCYDLQQVGQGDRRKLLRMREQLLKERQFRRQAKENNLLAASGGLPTGSKTQQLLQQQMNVKNKVGEDGVGGAVAFEDDNEGSEFEVNPDEELDDIARQLLAHRRAEEKEKKRKQKKLIDRKLKKVRGLINFDPNEANANAVIDSDQEDDDDDDDYEDISSSDDDDDEDYDSEDGGDDGAVKNKKKKKKKSNKKKRRLGEEGEGDDDEYYSDSEDDDVGYQKDGPIARLAKYSEKETAAALDSYARKMIDSGASAKLPNIPLNSINDVTLDPDDDMNDMDALHDSDDEHDEANQHKNTSELKRRSNIADLEELGSDFDPNDYILDQDDGELDVDETGNYIRAPRPKHSDQFESSYSRDVLGKKKSVHFGAGALGEDEEEGNKKKNKTPAELEEEKMQREQARKDRREAKLDEVGKNSKWERRHLNVDQVLRETFLRPKQQKKSSKRTEEDLVEMGDGASAASAVLSSSALSAKAKRERELKKAILANRLHDESASDDDNDDDEDEDDDDNDSMDRLQGMVLSDEDFDEGDLDAEDRQAERTGDAAAARLALRMSRPTAAKGGDEKFVPDQGKLTAQAQARELRKKLEKDNKKLAKKGGKAAAAVGGATAAAAIGGKKKSKNKKENTTFEEIPMAMADPTVRARTLALATKMLDKKSRSEILEGGVHRYMNNGDDDDMPDWFVEDEQKHYQLNVPITAHEVDQQRRRFLEMNSRPSKKVMEAMGRKRRKAQRVLRGMIEKGKTDPLQRNKTQGLSVRKLMRSKTLRGGSGAAGGGKKKGQMDSKKRGEMKRDKQRMKKMGKKTGGGGGGGRGRR